MQRKWEGMERAWHGEWDWGQGAIQDARSVRVVRSVERAYAQKSLTSASGHAKEIPLLERER